MFGIPAICEQGVDVDRANWRGIFTGQGVTAACQAVIVEDVRAATMHEFWQETLQQNRWKISGLCGFSFSSLIDIDLVTSGVMAHLLKLKAQAAGHR